MWEIAIERSLGRADFVVDPRLLRRGLLDNGYAELPITSEHAVAVDALRNLIGRGAFTLAVAVALSFGATQALANGPSSTRAASYCDKYECLDYCIEMEGVPGRCGYDQWGNFVCICG